MDLGSLWTRNDLASSSEQSPLVEWQCRVRRAGRCPWMTLIMRPEDGVWRIVHRHADAITTAQPAESIIQQ